MLVSKEIVHLENSSVKLTVTIDKTDVRSLYDELIADYIKTVQIPGFRKGKVPRTVLEHKFGEALKEEALGRVIEKGMTALFDEDKEFPEDAKPLPYSTPELQDSPKLDLSQDLKFSVVYDVLPKIEVPDYKGIEVERPDAVVGEDDINRELEELRERNALVIDKDGGAEAALNDVLTIDYTELDEAGAPVSGAERKDFVFTLGSGSLFYKFDDDLAGMKKGETREFDKTYAEDFPDPVMAGKTKKFRVTLTALKEKQLPALDDDLAQDINEKYKTLEDLKTNIRERLSRNLDARLRELVINNLLEKMLEKTDITVPESMIRLELDSRRRNLARQFNATDQQIMELLTASGKAYDEILDEWRPAAKKALQSRLIIETLIKNMALEASGDDLEKKFASMALEMDTSVDEIRTYYEQETMKEYLKEDIKERKLFDSMLADIIIKNGEKKNYLDVMDSNA